MKLLVPNRTKCRMFLQTETLRILFAHVCSCFCDHVFFHCPFFFKICSNNKNVKFFKVFAFYNLKLTRLVERVLVPKYYTRNSSMSPDTLFCCLLHVHLRSVRLATVGKSLGSCTKASSPALVHHPSKTTLASALCSLNYYMVPRYSL